jgi:hypothetical protein
MTNLTPDDFVINTYYPYAEWLKFIQRNELGMKLHLLSAGWRHRHVKIALSRTTLDFVEDNSLYADGDTVCSVCSGAYRDHPVIVGAEHLHLLCNGRGVKL